MGEAEENEKWYTQSGVYHRHGDIINIQFQTAKPHNFDEQAATVANANRCS